MARKGQVQIQENLETDEEFEAFLHKHSDVLICMEVYSSFCGNCLATGNAVRKIKMEMGQEFIAMAKAMSDNITALSRFKNKSEPVFLFISQGGLTQAVFGPKAIELINTAEEELKRDVKERESGGKRERFAIHEMLPVEAARQEEITKLEKEHLETQNKLRVVTLAARKRRICERLAPVLEQLNFILYWPHCHQAHLDLYEQWDIISIQIGAKEMLQLKEEDMTEVFYMSDVVPNEACVHALLSGEAMVVLFKKDDSRDFVSLLRHTIYEEIPVPKEDTPPEKRLPPIPAYERYATISKTPRQVRRDRYNLKMQILEEKRQEEERLAREQSRLLREAEEERLAEEKKKKEEERFARLQAGLPADPEPEETQELDEEGQPKAETETVTESEAGATTADETTDAEGTEPPAPVEQEKEFHSDEEIEGEDYIPPGGLFVPGLYSPPNDLAKCNGLVFFFPKVISKITSIESEFLPPHVLIMFTVDKRHEVNEIIKAYRPEILQLGVFVGDDPYNAEHIAYSLKQYEKMERTRRHLDRLALMVSRRRSLAMLNLAGLNPVYISSDAAAGERECLALFPVGYGDCHVEEESVVEEEIKVEEAAIETQPSVVVEKTEGAEEQQNDQEGED